MRPALRIFTGEDSVSAPAPAAPRGAMVTVSFGDILEPLAEALLRNRAFLTDFADDEIQLTTDLYDVLMACRRLRAGA